MEVCGTHTMAVERFGIRRLLPENVRLISGPGCPVCVTPKNYIDKAIALAAIDDIIVFSFGDMLKVPGTDSSLLKQRPSGNIIRTHLLLLQDIYVPSCFMLISF